MGARQKFSAEYKREAVAMLEAPGVTVSQIAAELGIWGYCVGPMAAGATSSAGVGPCGQRAVS